MRIVQLSDSHIFESGGVTTANLERVIEFVNGALRPDLVVHTGDIVGLDPDHAGDRRAGAALLAQVETPLLILPGNHDVGDTGESPWMGLGVSSARLAEHCSVFGDASFFEVAGGWGLIGLNSQVMGSGLPEEEEQWEWLERSLAATAARSLLIFMHRPLWSPDPAQPDGDNSVLGSARERLLSLPRAGRIRAVGSGHLHRYRRNPRPEMLEVWAPGTSYRGHRFDYPFQLEQGGIVEWRLGDDKVEAFFRAPHNLEEREFDDIPEVVARLEQVTQAGV